MPATPTEPVPRPSHAELTEMLEAPDLTKSERRELRRAARFQKRVELWERRATEQQPRKPHRMIIELVLMAATLAVFIMLVTR